MSTDEFTKKTKMSPDDQLNDPKLQHNDFSKEGTKTEFVPNNSSTSGIHVPRGRTTDKSYTPSNTELDKQNMEEHYEKKI